MNQLGNDFWVGLWVLRVYVAGIRFAALLFDNPSYVFIDFGTETASFVANPITNNVLMHL